MSKQFLLSRYVSLVACLAALVCVPSTARADKLLRWKFQKGDQRTVTIDQEMNIAMTKDEKTTNVQIRQTLVMRQVVDDVDEQGNATISHQFQQINVNVQGSPKISFSYDSANAAKAKGVEEIAPLLKSLTTSTFTTHMSPQGRILDVELPPEFTELSQSSPALRPGLFTFFSKEGFTQLMQDSVAVFSDQPVEENDQWTDKVEVENPMAGKQIMTTTHTYKGEEDEGGRVLDKIQLNVVIEFAPKDEGAVSEIKAEDQNTTGTIWFDAAAGGLVRGNVNQKLVMEVNGAEGKVRTELTGKVDIQVTTRAPSE